jgi:hypothetical protein
MSEWLENDRAMAGIVISGERADEWIRFKPLPEISASSFVVSACLRGRTVSTDLAVQGIDAFLATLTEFERTRSGQAILEGTYDFRLVVRAYGRTGAAWLGFHLAELLWLEDRTHGRHVLDGGFPIAGEMVGQMVRDFKGLVAPSQGYP